jgi:hypothetical protein
MSDLHDDYTIAGAQSGLAVPSADSESDTLRRKETDALRARGNPLLSDVCVKVRCQPFWLYTQAMPRILTALHRGDRRRVEWYNCGIPG